MDYTFCMYNKTRNYQDSSYLSVMTFLHEKREQVDYHPNLKCVVSTNAYVDDRTDAEDPLCYAARQYEEEAA